VVVAFRGTEPLNADDWLADVNYHHEKLNASIPGLVHGGFARALEELLKQELMKIVDDLMGTDAPRLFLTGHSLGGALAVLEAAWLYFVENRSVAAVYTYGQPRVGDPDFSSAYNAALGEVTFRYVNDQDIVPHLPPVLLPGVPIFRGPTSLASSLRWLEGAPEEVQDAIRAVIKGETFAHVGQLKLFLDNHTLTSDDAQWQKRELSHAGTLGDLLGSDPKQLRAALSEILTAGNRLIDHDPLTGYLPRLSAQLLRGDSGGSMADTVDLKL
jgi:hypothetical protein